MRKQPVHKGPRKRQCLSTTGKACAKDVSTNGKRTPSGTESITTFPDRRHSGLMLKATKSAPQAAATFLTPVDPEPYTVPTRRKSEAWSDSNRAPAKDLGFGL